MRLILALAVCVFLGQFSFAAITRNNPDGTFTVEFEKGDCPAGHCSFSNQNASVEVASDSTSGGFPLDPLVIASGAIFALDLVSSRGDQIHFPCQYTPRVYHYNKQKMVTAELGGFYCGNTYIEFGYHMPMRVYFGEQHDIIVKAVTVMVSAK